MCGESRDRFGVKLRFLLLNGASSSHSWHLCFVRRLRVVAKRLPFPEHGLVSRCYVSLQVRFSGLVSSFVCILYLRLC